jgi:fructokinase
MADLLRDEILSLQNGDNFRSKGRPDRLLALGEVLWDVFEHSMRLGGAPLNFSAHAKRLGYDPLLISAVGNDELGDRTAQNMADLGLDTKFLQRTSRFKTGTARVELGPGDRTRFVISRPAAYDSVTICDEELKLLKSWAPDWFYYGTLFSHLPQGKAVLQQLLDAFPSCFKFYDLNLRPGYDSEALVIQLLALADVVKLNEEELEAVHKFTSLPFSAEAFCREGSKRYGWRAACVTLGARGCAILCGDEYIEAGGHAVDVADPVGAGDAFAAAFLHGLISQWPVAKIAAFANRVGAIVASRHGAIPDWTVKEAVEL